MKYFLAFLHKEATEHKRTGKWTILGILFVLFGIMNPAIAKMTPWLMEMMADSMEEAGMSIHIANITAMDSWVQFYKNIPMTLVIFVLLEGSIFTKEYQKGTLMLSLTKGMPRHSVLWAKTAMLTATWTMGYWLCFGITYSYNAYFWDNSIAQHLLFSAVCWWVFGLWAICLMVFFSVLANTTTVVLLGSGSIVLASYLLGLLPKLSKYLPTMLTDGNSLIYGTAAPTQYLFSLALTGCLGTVLMGISIPLLNKKQL